MSWQAVSFLILAAVLIGGFAWYERSRPPAQVIALVAALAALAVAGRVAFVAIPNVVATTDIVLFAGYALGAAPGFAVGALAGLVANLWLGQGPWTPWQMAGWGLCGVFGAMLALRRRDVGRLGLAAACGAAAVAYGALLNFSLMATYGGQLSLDRFLALQASALPFDAAHALGNVTLALVAGPAMVRMLIRFRERFEWQRRAPAAGRLRAAAVAALLLAAALAASAPERAQAGPQRATSWLASQQNADGGWGASPERESGVEMTGWAMLGLEAAGRNPQDVRRGGRSPVGYVERNLGEIRSPGDLARTILALDGAGVDTRRFGGRNLVAELRDRRRDNGSYQGWPTSSAFAVLALRAAGARGGLDPTIRWLAKVQNGDGGWGDTPDSPSNPDSTGSVMQAIPSTDAARRGLRYLRRHQNGSGGFALGGFGGVNSQSTAWAVQGMVAVGANPASIRRNGRNALDYLAARQADDGHYRYSKSSDQTPVWVTSQALVATSRDAFPISPPPREPSPSNSQSTTSTPNPVPAPSPVPTGGGGFSPVAPAGVGAGSGAGAGAPSGQTPGAPSTTAPGVTPGTTVDPFGTGEEAPAGPAVDGAEPTPSAGPGKQKDDSPAAPIGVGLATGIVALGGTVLLGRRFHW